jgi:hypothetical protein
MQAILQHIDDWFTALVLNGTAAQNITVPPRASLVSVVPSATPSQIEKRGVPNVRWLSRARLDADTLPDSDTAIMKVASLD